MITTSTSQSSPSGRQRTPKLRAACNLCCAAKVKCSGQKTGCERCRTTGSQCVYVESRVGKVPGLRAKRAGKLPQNIMPRRENTQIYAVPRPITPAPSSQDSVSALFDTGHDDILSWGNDSQLSSTNDQLPEYMDNSTMDFSLNDLLHTSRSSPDISEHASSTAPPMPLSLGLRPRNEQDSQCILECCHIINDLENYIMADLKALKILLNIIRKTLASLTTLIGFQQGSRNLRCLFLFSTIMYQVLEMLESSVANARSSAQTINSFPSSSRLRIPSLGFGDFDMDPEEQSAWRLQTILKEVHHATDVLRKIKVLSGVGPDEGHISGNESSSRGGKVGESRESCYLDLELRFQELSGRIARLN